MNTNFLSPTYEDFTTIVAFMNFFLSRIFFLGMNESYEHSEVL